MGQTTPPAWRTLDRTTRRRLDEEYLRDLSWWSVPGLTGRAVRAYLRFRHERPGAAITTFEEGRVRRLMAPRLDHSGDTRPLLWTPELRYVAVMLGLVAALIVSLLVVVSLA